MISDVLHLLGMAFIYLMFGCVLLGCIVVPYGVVKLAVWNLRRSRLFKRDD